jgi:hypothetical protein
VQELCSTDVRLQQLAALYCTGICALKEHIALLLLLLQVGVCPQFDMLWGALTGLEHLVVAGHVKGLPFSEVSKGPNNCWLRVMHSRCCVACCRPLLCCTVVRPCIKPVIQPGVRMLLTVFD